LDKSGGNKHLNNKTYHIKNKLFKHTCEHPRLRHDEHGIVLSHFNLSLKKRKKLEKKRPSINRAHAMPPPRIELTYDTPHTTWLLEPSWSPFQPHAEPPWYPDERPNAELEA
jgi:hypothetical protein